MAPSETVNIESVKYPIFKFFLLFTHFIFLNREPRKPMVRNLLLLSQPPLQQPQKVDSTFKNLDMIIID